MHGTGASAAFPKGCCNACAEAVVARRIGQRLAITLKVLVERRAGAVVPDIVIAAVGVAMPDLDPCAGNRPPVRVENAPADVAEKIEALIESAGGRVIEKRRSRTTLERLFLEATRK